MVVFSGSCYHQTTSLLRQDSLSEETVLLCCFQKIRTARPAGSHELPRHSLTRVSRRDATALKRWSHELLQGLAVCCSLFLEDLSPFCRIYTAAVIGAMQDVTRWSPCTANTRSNLSHGLCLWMSRGISWLSCGGHSLSP